jgi:electron-transferring-flavoprotein dehydrogenase
MDPRAINELIPDWKEKGAPLNQPVTADKFLFFTETGRDGDAASRSARLLPQRRQLHHQPRQRRALAGDAGRALGVEIFPGFPAPRCCTARTAACAASPPATSGIGKDGEPTANFQLGMELHAKYTIFAEGSRGSLGRQLIARFKLDEGRDPQSYGIGLKELWEVKPERAEPGLTLQPAAGRSTRRPTAARSSITSTTTRSTLGFVVGLDYENPYLSPFEEFQRWKSHPEIRKTLEGRQAPGLRRARDHRRRHPEPAQDGVSRAVPSSAVSRATSTRAGSRAVMRRSSPACLPPKPRSTPSSPAASTTSSPPIRPRSRRAGCAPSSTSRATSSSGSRRASWSPR